MNIVPAFTITYCEHKPADTGLARNKLTTSEGTRMRSTGPNEIKFVLQPTQMMGFTFIK